MFKQNFPIHNFYKNIFGWVWKLNFIILIYYNKQKFGLSIG